MPTFNTFSVLKPIMKDTFAEKKLKRPKLVNPKPKKPKVIIPGQGGY